MGMREKITDAEYDCCPDNWDDTPPPMPVADWTPCDPECEDT